MQVTNTSCTFATNFFRVRYYFTVLLFCLASLSCKHIDVYEKQVALPSHEWYKKQHLVINFDITDSTSHQLYLVVRHTEQFPYNKLLVNLSIQDTAKHTLSSINITAPLTDQNNNWRGIAMDDIYYSRFLIKPPIFLKPGIYRFVLSHQMKEDPLTHLLNMGIAIDQ